MDVIHKSFEVKELSEEGQVKAVISTFGQQDRDGDIMDAGAFKGSNGKSIPMVWSHNWDDPVGRGVIASNGKEATFTGQFFMETVRGQEAYKTVKAMGDLQEYSIGFRVVDQAFNVIDNGKGGQQRVRTFKDIELFEASPVLVGAAYGTHTVGIKNAAQDELVTAEKALEALKSASVDDIHALKELIDTHIAACDQGGDCPLAYKAASSDDASISPERKKTLQEISARVAKA